MTFVVILSAGADAGAACAELLHHLCPEEEPQLKGEDLRIPPLNTYRQKI